MNVATGGFGTEITAQTDEGLKNKLGGAAYLLTGISKPGSVSAKEATGRVPLTAYTKRDDEYQKIQIGPDHFAEVKDNARHGEKVAEFSGSLLVLAVGNSRQAGGGRELCPDAIIDDGLLDVSYIINPSLDQIPNIMGNLLDGSSSVSDMKELFGTLRCNWLEVDCPDELQVNRDGEPMRATKYQFEILPHRLYLHLPNTKLLNRRKDHDTLSDTSSNSGRTSPQKRYVKKINNMSRPQFEDRKQAKVKAIAGSAARLGLVFGAGGMAGVLAQRRGWFGASGR
jgi:hypothetical protein